MHHMSNSTRMEIVIGVISCQVISLGAIAFVADFRYWYKSDSLCLQNDIYTSDSTTKGAMYGPIILGSDKTTVSVAMGHIEYHPLYLSVGGVHNSVHCAHRNAVIPIGFLAIPKCQ